MSERDTTASEASQDSSLLGRMKQAVGLSPRSQSPRGYKIDVAEHEAEASPHAETTTTTQAAFKEAAAPKAEEKERMTSPSTAAACRGSSSTEPTIEAPHPSRVGVQKLHKPQEVEGGLAKPKELSAQSQIIEEPLLKEVRPTTSAAPALHTPSPAPEAPVYERFDVPSHIIADLEAKGYHHVGHRISHGTGAPAASAGTAAALEEELPRPLVQGDRVKVAKIGGGGGAVGIGGAGQDQIQDVYARPGFEGEPLSAAEVAEMKAKEHAIIAREAHARAEAKHEELRQLRRQAEALEKQSAALLEEVAGDQKRVEVARMKEEKMLESEWRGYAQAEHAEVERRAVVERAKPAARAAEAQEREAILKKQDAADAEFHAQVLENRARALLKESHDMAELSIQLAAQALSTKAQLLLVRQETEEMMLQIDTQAARGLPQYIKECETEIGALQHRISQLREEISWAQGEIDRGRQEEETWRRVVVAKESAAARLLLEWTQLNEDSEEARQRSKSAAEEARLPMELASQKYEEAWAAEKEAREAEEAAKEAQREALEVVKGAAAPAEERQRALREAAAAEAAAVQLETRTEIVEGKVRRRLYEAEVKAQTAAEKMEEVERKEAEGAREEEIEAAEERIADTYRAQQKEHRPIPVPVV